MIELTILMLGYNVLVRCNHQQCANEIGEYFQPMIGQPWRTPDIIVECNWSESNRYLFRARPDDSTGPLVGVRVSTPGSVAEDDWPYKEPPLPPFMIEPLRNRFVGLHAGAVRTDDGRALLVLGERHAGKTTASVRLANDYGLQLITDETVFLHRRTRFAEPFPRAVNLREVRNGREEKRILPAGVACQKVAQEGSLICELVFLERSSTSTNAKIRELNQEETFKLLLKHHLNVGCDLDEAVVTLMELSRVVHATAYHYSMFGDLQEGVEMFAKLLRTR